MIDHVTIHVPPGTLEQSELRDFMKALCLMEIPTEDRFEHGWSVRWFRAFQVGLFGSIELRPALHLVEGTADIAFGGGGGRTGVEEDRYGLGHFCVILDAARFAALRHTEWCVRDSGSGRIWLQFENIRVEVRSR